MTLIVNQTNNNIRRYRGKKKNDKFLKDKRFNYLGETDEIEIRALLGLMYLRGAVSQTKHDVRHLFGVDGHHGCVLYTPFLVNF
jgi:hypothetical protein